MPEPSKFDLEDAPQIDAWTSSQLVAFAQRIDVPVIAVLGVGLVAFLARGHVQEMLFGSGEMDRSFRQDADGTLLVGRRLFNVLCDEYTNTGLQIMQSVNSQRKEQAENAKAPT